MKNAPAPAFQISLSVPQVTAEDKQAVLEAMESGWVAPAGPYLKKFENRFCEHLGVYHAAALSSGTAALHLAMILAGVKAGDEVLCSTFTFVATANPILYLGATPIFIDSEERTWNLDPQLLRDYLSGRRKSGKPIPRVLMLAHIYGQPAEMEPILEVCREFEVLLVEDAAEALGARYRDKPVGSFGEIAAFSFNGNKVITTGGGGMLVSPNAAWVKRARYLASQARDEGIAYYHSEVGFNYRLSSLSAALGCSQLERLEASVRRKREIFNSYCRLFEGVPGIIPMPTSRDVYESRWLSSFYLDPEETKTTPERVVIALGQEGIEARPLWWPLHQQPIYRDAEVVNRGVAERLRVGGISLPSSPDLSSADLERITEIVLAQIRR